MDYLELEKHFEGTNWTILTEDVGVVGKLHFLSAELDTRQKTKGFVLMDLEGFVFVYPTHENRFWLGFKYLADKKEYTSLEVMPIEIPLILKNVKGTILENTINLHAYFEEEVIKEIRTTFNKMLELQGK